MIIENRLTQLAIRLRNTRPTPLWLSLWNGRSLDFGPDPKVTIVVPQKRAPRYRNEGTALFSLMRNIGSSIGISVVMTYLAQRTQANQAAFADYINSFNLALRQAVEAGAYSLSTLQGLAAINGEVTRQAATLAYLQDFRLMIWITVAAIPLIILLRASPKKAAVNEMRAAME